MDENGASSQNPLSKQDKLAEVGPWAKEKLGALRRYLDYYTTRLKKKSWRTIYLDAFAGGGKAVLRSELKNESQTEQLFDGIDGNMETSVFVDGSPRVALSLATPFHRYIFIDQDQQRIAELEALRAEFDGKTKIYIRCESATEGIDWLTSQRIRKSTHRGVAFLDPFGANLDWGSVDKLAQTKLFEVFINFPLAMAIQRMLPNSGIVPHTWSLKLDNLFGDRTWFEATYRPRSPGLFEDEGHEKRSDYGDRLLDLYKGKLKSAFGYVSDARLIRNTRGAPLYYLIWAGPHPAGLHGANYILNMEETSYADAANKQL